MWTAPNQTTSYWLAFIENMGISEFLGQGSFHKIVDSYTEVLRKKILQGNILLNKYRWKNSKTTSENITIHHYEI